MKKITVTVALLLCALVCAGVLSTQAHAMLFVEGWNVDQEWYAYSNWAVSQIAWKYVPTETYYLSRIEFYNGNTSNTNNNRVITYDLRADVNGQVGSSLSSGSFQHTATVGWQGVDITPYQVIAGQSYWIATWYVGGMNTYTTMSNTGTAVPLRYGTGSNSNSYPYGPVSGYKPMAKFYSPVPEPATLVLLGVGLVGVFGMRKRYFVHRT